MIDSFGEVRNNKRRKEEVAQEEQINTVLLSDLVEEYKTAVDPLVRLSCVVANTTPAERTDIIKSAVFFCRAGPIAPPPAFPIPLDGVAEVAFVGDPAGNNTELRFSGVQQVANWIADVQSRAYGAPGRSVRLVIELTSDNGGHWSAPVRIFC